MLTEGAGEAVLDDEGPDAPLVPSPGYCILDQSCLWRKQTIPKEKKSTAGAEAFGCAVGED
jgi:hypothetical protein